MGTTAHEQIACEFGGKREGSAALSWGQYSVWDGMRRNSAGALNHCAMIPLPDETELTIPAVSDIISHLVTRHEALRTWILSADDGKPYQIVKRGGVLPLVIQRCDEDSIAETRDALAVQLTGSYFDYSVEGPIRVGLVVVGDRVREVAFVLCRMIADAHSCLIVEHELQLLLHGETLPAESPLQPLDLTVQQESPRWQRHSARALAYWKQGCGRAVSGMFMPVAPASDPLVQSLLMDSEALWLATRSVAHRYGVSTSTVLLAASAALIGRWTGSPTCVMQVGAHNRFLPRNGEMVMPLAQRGLLVMDLAGRSTVDELIKPTADAALQAYRYGYYDQEAVGAAIARMSDERGTDMAPSFFFNDLRPDAALSPVDKDGVSAADATSAEIQAALERSRTSVLGGLNWVQTPVNIKAMPIAGAMVLRLTVDTRYMPPDRLEPFMREFERLVVEASLRQD